MEDSEKDAALKNCNERILWIVTSGIKSFLLSFMEISSRTGPFITIHFSCSELYNLGKREKEFFMPQDLIINHDLRQPDFSKPDGGLRPVIGTTNIQVFRANREQPEMAEGTGWTYNHQPYLAYWNEMFYLEYLSNPAAEHEGPGQTLLTTSKDGLHWSKPQIIFPPYPLEDGLYSIMHQRMGFYRTSDDRLLVLAFYGSPCPYPWPPKWDMPNDGRGIGRVVREVYKDGNLSPIYFIRYNRHAGWHENNTRLSVLSNS